MRHAPQRSCVGCRAVRDKKELVRIVRDPEGKLAPDPTAKAAGRGAYLCPSAECLELAARRKGFDRAFRQPLPGEAVAALRERFDEYLRARTDRAAARPESLRAPGGAAGTNGG